MEYYKIIDLDIPTVEYDLSKIDRNITKEELKNYQVYVNNILKFL